MKKVYLSHGGLLTGVGLAAATEYKKKGESWTFARNYEGDRYELTDKLISLNEIIKNSEGEVRYKASIDFLNIFQTTIWDDGSEALKLAWLSEKMVKGDSGQRIEAAKDFLKLAESSLNTLLSNGGNNSEASFNEVSKQETKINERIKLLSEMSWEKLAEDDLLQELKDIDYLQFKLKYKQQFGTDYISASDRKIKANAAAIKKEKVYKSERLNILSSLSWKELSQKDFLLELKGLSLSVFKDKFLKEFNKEYIG